MKDKLDIFLEEPKVFGNRISYSWNQNPLLKGNGFWIEYPDVTHITASLNEIIVPYLVICLAMAAFGGVRVHLPVELDEQTISNWLNIIKGTAQDAYRRAFKFELINGTRRIERHSWEGANTALLFGGGTESLLCLARLKAEGIKPLLISFRGPNWNGSNQEKNPHKFEFEEMVCRDFDLKLVRISTSFRELIRSHDVFWKNLLVDGAWNIVTTALFSSFYFTFTLPIAEHFRIGKVVSGSEKENNVGKFYYSFSSEAVQRLKGLNANITYVLYLNDLWKSGVVRELFTEHQELLKYQYSCLCNAQERWCLKCEKCFRNYLFYKIYKIDPLVGGIDEEKIKRYLPNLIWKARWQIVSKDPAVSIDYNHLRSEAEKMNSREAEEILNKVLNRHLLVVFLNVFRQMHLVQLLKKPLKKLFYYLQGYSAEV